MGLRFGSLQRALGDLGWGAVLAVPVLFDGTLTPSLASVGLLMVAPEPQSTKWWFAGAPAVTLSPHALTLA